MKRCVYCAEQIQTEAVLCRFCNQRQPIVAVTESGSGVLAWFAGLALVLITVGIAAGFVGVYSGKSGAKPALESAVEFIKPPAVVRFSGESDLRLPPGLAQSYEFRLDDPRPCRFQTRVVGLDGGNEDFDVFLVDRDGMANFRNDRRFEAYFSRRKTSAVTIDVVVPGGASYYLVISNQFSVVTRKRVEVEPPTAVCGA